MRLSFVDRLWLDVLWARFLFSSFVRSVRVMSRFQLCLLVTGVVRVFTMVGFLVGALCSVVLLSGLVVIDSGLVGFYGFFAGVGVLYLLVNRWLDGVEREAALGQKRYEKFGGC
jgi:hypothetical protein